MKRIGIVTFHGANNYGAVLQNFALQKCIENLGYNVETVDYINRNLLENYRLFSPFISKHPIILVKRKYWEARNFKKAIKSRSAFDEFRRLHLKLSEKCRNIKEIRDLRYDLLVTGSDQVWNVDIVGQENVPVYDLSFFDGKKASYAASCGSLSRLFDISKGICKLNRVTVREFELLEFLRGRGIDAGLVCDPTLLLDSEQWKQLLNLYSMKDTGRYVYLYYIDSGKIDAAKIANYLATEMEGYVVHSKKMDRETEKYHFGICHFEDGPVDFLNRILNAECVVASSFHGVVFSLLFHKDFYAILHDKTGDRVRGLLFKVGLEERIMENYEDFIARKDSIGPIDYNKIDSIIYEWKNQSMLELMNICNM